MKKQLFDIARGLLRNRWQTFRRAVTEFSLREVTWNFKGVRCE
jgi:hypothetical protein